MSKQHWTFTNLAVALIMATLIGAALLIFGIYPPLLVAGSMTIWFTTSIIWYLITHTEDSAND